MEREQNTEEKIFDAARAVFHEHGYDGARMQEIADRAGINKAMLHYYFRSKDRLYEQVFDYVFGRFMASIAESLRDAPTFREALLTFIDAYVGYHARHPAVARLFVHENLAGAPVAKAIVARRVRDNPASPHALFVDRLNRAIDAGEVRPVDPLHTFITLLGASVFFFLALPTLSVLDPDTADDMEAAVEARKVHLFDLLYHGLEAH